MKGVLAMKWCIIKAEGNAYIWLVSIYTIGPWGRKFGKRGVSAVEALSKRVLQE